MAHNYLAILLSAAALSACYGAAGANDRSTNSEPAPQESDSQQSDSQRQAESESEPVEDETDDDRSHSDDPGELPPDQQPPPPDRNYDISEVYATTCVDCHGHRGDGDGTENQGFNFAAPADEWTNGPTVDGILDTLDDGIHDSAMQRFPQFSTQDRIELAEYVIDLRYELKGED